MYAKIIDNIVIEYPYGPDVLRRDNPQTSFPEQLSEELLAEWNIFTVESRNPPQFNYITENCNRVTPTLDNGVWVETWEVTNASADETNLRLEEKANGIISQRNSLLLESDWTQVADAPVDKNVWAVYRQQLRDVTSQSTFPYSVQWPNSPDQ